MVWVLSLAESSRIAQSAIRFVATAVLVSAFVAVLDPADARADAPRVAFDMDPVIACRDVTTAEFSESYPHERLIEASWSVSSLIRDGREDDLIEFLFWLETTGQPFRVFDYAPRTTLASDQAGNVSIERKTERSRGVSVAVTAPHAWPAKLSGGGDFGSKNSDAVRYELVPEMTPVAASGTIQGGSGVYFKLRPSRSTSLEGAKEFSVTFRVPASWRAGCAVLTCTARGEERGVLPLLKDQVVCGRHRFLVALYQGGDLDAQITAEDLIRAKSHLVRTVVAKRREIERQFYPTVAHKVGVLLDVIPPRLPSDWTEQVIYGAASADLENRIASRMPGSVRNAVSQYAVARRELSRMSRHAKPSLQ